MTSPSEDYRLIPLTQGQFTKVSQEDYDSMMRWTWYAKLNQNNNCFYAYRGYGRPCINIPMHRQILNLRPGDKRQGDHINLDTLDNRRSNLRIVTSSQNRMNTTVRSGNTSGYKGVHWCNTRNHWIARIVVNGRSINLGHFASAEEGHTAYCKASKTYHGEFGRIS